jgi:hypothetical protein
MVECSYTYLVIFLICVEDVFLSMDRFVGTTPEAILLEPGVTWQYQNNTVQANYTFYFTNVVARYIRIVIDKTAFLAIAELQVYSDGMFLSVAS